MTVAFASLAAEILDPILGATENKKQLSLLYDWVVGINKDATAIDSSRGVAYRWEKSADSKVWTFYLRQGIKFHNGAELTADDVKFSLDRVMGTGSVSSMAAAFRTTIESIEVPDKYTIVFRLKVPTFTLPYDLSPMVGNEGAVVPKAYIEEKGAKYFATHPIGSGAYKFVEQVTGDHMTYEAVDWHWAIGAPKYKTIQFKIVPENSTREALLQRGEADIIAVSRLNAATMASKGFNIFETPGDAIATMAPHQQWETGPLNDKNVRLALALAIDRKQILDSLLGGRGRLTGNYIAGKWAIGYKPLEPYPYDVARAKQLLADAGYQNGFTVNLYAFVQIPESDDIAQTVAAYWSKIGVQAKINKVDSGTMRKMRADKTLPNPSIVGPINLGQRVITSSITRDLQHSKGGLTATADPKLDSIIDAMSATADEGKFADLVQQVSQYIYDNAIHIVLFEVNTTYATSSKIKDWKMGQEVYGINLAYLYTP